MLTKDMPTEIYEFTASQIATLIRGREISAAEVAQSQIQRIEAVNQKINAVVDSNYERTLNAARVIDTKLAKNEAVGALAGVPVTIKVNLDEVGYSTTNGARIYRNLIAVENSPVVDNLTFAGAFSVGRTNVPAFSVRWFTDNSLYGATLNPHNKELTPGGSSGGAASATAAGIGCIGIGTDIGGSVRYPAYACGLHGLRPTLGRVAAYNASAKSDRTLGGQIMAVAGPIARSIEDIRLALHAMARADLRDPWWVPAPLTYESMPKRAAVCLHPDGMATHPLIVRELLSAADKLRDAGWIVDELENLPPLRQAVGIQKTLWLGDSYPALLKLAEEEGDPAAIVAYTGQKDFAATIGMQEYSDSLKLRSTLLRQWQLFMNRYSVVLTPNSADLPFEDNLDLKGAEGYAQTWESLSPMLALPALGLPGLSVCTAIEDNVPLGIHIIAQRYREDACLAAGADIEARSQKIRVVTPQ